MSPSKSPRFGRGQQVRSGGHWASIRRRVFQRDGHTCQVCLEIHDPRDLRADHVIPRAQGGSDDLANLQTLCVPCHNAKTRNDNARTAGRLPGAGVRQAVVDWRTLEREEQAEEQARARRHRT